MSKQDILDYFSDINYAYNDSTRLDTLSRMLDELVEQAASPWHRVEEPPKEGQNVLTMDANEDMETAIYDGEGFEDSYGFYVTNVLYWMPIEPPKEVQDGRRT